MCALKLAVTVLVLLVRVSSIKIQIENVTDKYNDRVGLFYDGSNVTLHCDHSEAGERVELLLNEQPVDEAIASKQANVFFVVDSKKVGKYECKDKSGADESEACRGCQTTKKGYCTEDEKESGRRGSCGTIPLEKCNILDIQDVCVKDGKYGKSMCKLEEGEKPRYTRSDKDCDWEKGYFYAHREENEVISIGSSIQIPQTTLSWKCSRSVDPTCVEKAFFDSEMVKRDAAIECGKGVSFNRNRFETDVYGSYVSKLVCEGQDSESSTKVSTYHFLVNIDADISANYSSESCGVEFPNVTCFFRYPLFDNSFTPEMELLYNGTSMQKSASLKTTFTVGKAGSYSCKGTITYRSCSPITEYKNSSESDSVEVEERCIPTAKTLPGVSTGVGGSNGVSTKGSNGRQTHPLRTILRKVCLSKSPHLTLFSPGGPSFHAGMIGGILVGMMAVAIGIGAVYYFACYRPEQRRRESRQRKKTSTPYDKVLTKSGRL